jgi:hypothetical protein
MSNANRSAVLAAVTRQYLESRDFNGLPLSQITLPSDEVKQACGELIRGGFLSISMQGNPHIRAFGSPAPSEAQLEYLNKAADLNHVVAYPESKHLEATVDRAKYDGRPYTLRLALGSGQLDAVYFELSALERYRNDPRYYYETNEASGQISVTDEHFESAGMKEADQVLLQTFGFGYNEAMQRSVCVFLRYLDDLSPEHQQVWRTYELDGDYLPHPAYYKPSILGEFPDGISMFEAFMGELKQLERLSALIFGTSIVLNRHDGKPASMTFLIRPTLRELQDFHATLDKLMSDNLNKRFFAERLAAAGIETDGKGTIQLLQDWLGTIGFEDRTPVDDAVQVFRDIRKLRQRPAHSLDDNGFDLEYYEQQRAMMARAHRAVHVLRLVLQGHPGVASDDQVPEWLDGIIYKY